MNLRFSLRKILGILEASSGQQVPRPKKKQTGHKAGLVAGFRVGARSSEGGRQRQALSQGLVVLNGVGFKMADGYF